MMTPSQYAAMGWLPASPARILDVGCGAGRAAVPLARQGYTVTGTDCSAPLVRAAAKLACSEGVSAHFQVAEADTVRGDLGCLDAVMSIRQYCYLPGRDLRQRYLNAIKGVLRPAGLVLVVNHVVPNMRPASSRSTLQQR